MQLISSVITIVPSHALVPSTSNFRFLIQSTSTMQLSSSRNRYLHSNQLTTCSSSGGNVNNNIMACAAAALMLTAFSLDEPDVFDILPAHPLSDGFMYSTRTSLNSLLHESFRPCTHSEDTNNVGVEAIIDGHTLNCYCPPQNIIIHHLF